jgi:hypothetical protein
VLRAAVPEAPVNENRDACTSKNQVCPATHA